MSYFNNLRDEEYRERRPSQFEDSFNTNGSSSDRFHDEPDRDSRDAVRRPLRGGDRDTGSVSVATTNTNTTTSVSTAAKKKKKKKKISRERAMVIPESEPLVPTTVVRNDSQADSSMASQSYSLRSNTLSFGSSSSNILEAYRKLKASQRGSTSGSSSLLPRHHEEASASAEHEHSSANTHTSTQRTPATSTSTQMSTDDDHYPNNGNNTQQQQKQHNTRVKRSERHNQNHNKPPKHKPQRQYQDDLVDEYTPTKPQPYQDQIPEQAPIVAAYVATSPEYPPPEQAPPKPKTKKRSSKRGSVSKMNAELIGKEVTPETVQENSSDTTPSSRTPQKVIPRRSSVVKNPYNNNDSDNVPPLAPQPAKHQLREQASNGVPVQQVYASYGRDNPMAPPSAVTASTATLPYNNTSHHNHSHSNSPVPGAHAVLARNMALGQSQHQPPRHHSPPPPPSSRQQQRVTVQDHSERTPVMMDESSHRPTDYSERSGGPPRHITTANNKSTTKRGTSFAQDNTIHEAEAMRDDSMDVSSFHPVHLKESLESGQFDQQVSRKMDKVKHNIRRQMTNPPPETPKSPKNKRKSRRPKKNKEDGGSSHGSLSSSSSSSSGGHGILGFLSGFKGHPKSQMTDEERRAAQNPFLNRPTNVKTFNTIGHFGDKKRRDDESSSSSRSSKDHARRNDDDYSGSGSSYTSESTKKPRFPLPAPIRNVQQFCGRVVTNTQFQVFMIVLIMLNALVLGIATYDFDNPKIPQALDIIDRILLVVFTIELALQFGYCGYNLFLDGWLVFDTLTVVTSWWLEGVQVFRSFRIFRSFRLIVRLPLLKNLVLTVFHVMPRIYSILCLLLLVLYVFGVLVTILYGAHPWGEPPDDVDYFGHLGLSIFTLFQMVTLEGWGEVVRLVAAKEGNQWSASLIFSTFVVITGFIMYNLIVAVMCDSMLVIEAQGREELREQQKERKLLDEIAKQEEEKRMHDEMLAQRKQTRGRRDRLKGLVNDDPTIGGDPEGTQGSELSSEQSLTKGSEEEESEEEEIEYRAVMCPHCDQPHEVPKYPHGYHFRKRRREEAIVENRERVQALRGQVEQLAATQMRVTNVLQTLMLEIEASRLGKMAGSDGDTFNLSMGDFSLEEYQGDQIR